MNVKASKLQPGMFYRENGRLYLITGVQKLADGLEIGLDGLPPIWRHPDADVWVETQTTIRNNFRQAFGKVGEE